MERRERKGKERKGKERKGKERKERKGKGKKKDEEVKRVYECEGGGKGWGGMEKMGK